MSNHLAGQTSPYLLQHAENPVDWYPWGEEAFQKARAEDKPIFLSIGYSTCHWCHVMARESFENPEIAELLNKHFVSVKVDKEERPDIDSIYMAVCQALTGSGGWPTSIFMTPEQKPFYAGIYFPPKARYGSPGFGELLRVIHEKWKNARPSLLKSAESIVTALNQVHPKAENPHGDLIEKAVGLYEKSYDEKYGGFGDAPKFPSAHNIVFLLMRYNKSGDKGCLEMAEKSLIQMYRGGMFDHIGGGFCRYSTDRFFLVPHFEKMLYDNALLIIAYCAAYSSTKKQIYLEVAERTAGYVLREMTSPERGFFSAQDADSDGEEGKFYVFSPSEIIELLGEHDGKAFNSHYGIDSENFEGKSIPNLLNNTGPENELYEVLPKVYEYRRNREKLHLDDKILTSWNGLMISALCRLYAVSRKPEYLEAAKKAQTFIEEKLYRDDTLFSSFCGGKTGETGFIDDYAYFILALLSLFEATYDACFLKKAYRLYQKAVSEFYDALHGGFYFYGNGHEKLILRPKETYDGAMPSGNSVMAYNLLRLSYYLPDDELNDVLEGQLEYMSAQAGNYPAGCSMFLIALYEYTEPPCKIVAVKGAGADFSHLAFEVPPESIVTVLESPTREYPLKDGKSTYYVCKGHSCLAPVNSLDEI